MGTLSTTGGDLRIEGRKLFVKSGGETRRISGLMANSKHWRSLADAMAQR